MTESPDLWLNRPGQDTLQRGMRREQAEQSADASYDRLHSPPCPACGKLVSDREWETHKYAAHGINEMVQPWGRPDTREALFIHVHAQKLEEKIALWRRLHPGVGLALAGEGFDRERRLYWQRFLLLDGRGRRPQ